MGVSGGAKHRSDGRGDARTSAGAWSVSGAGEVRVWVIRGADETIVVPRNDLRAIRIRRDGVQIVLKELRVGLSWESEVGQEIKPSDVLAWMSEAGSEDFPGHRVTVEWSGAGDEPMFWRGSLKAWVLLSVTFLVVLLLFVSGLL